MEAGRFFKKVSPGPVPMCRTLLLGAGVPATLVFTTITHYSRNLLNLRTGPAAGPHSLTTASRPSAPAAYK